MGFMTEKPKICIFGSNGQKILNFFLEQLSCEYFQHIECIFEHARALPVLSLATKKLSCNKSKVFIGIQKKQE